MNNKLYAGVARAVITPEVGCNLYGYRDDIISTAVLDDLNATAFYFEQEGTKALMISCDVATVRDSKKITAEIEKKFNIPEDNCIISATHTHSGPNTGSTDSGWGVTDDNYLENTFIPGILGAVEEAIESAVPVTVGYAFGNSKVGINRREMKISSKEYTSLGQNEWGCYNPKMTVISFRDENGDNIGTMVHYGCHATAAGANTEITRDWPGVMVDQLEKVTGGIAAFFNGPEGDVGPRLSNGGTSGRGDISYIYEIGNVAAQDAIRIFKSISSYRDENLAVASGLLMPPMGERISLEEAKKQYEKFKQYTVNIGSKAKNHYKDIIESYENGYKEVDHIEWEQTVLRIGDVAFASFPLELFSEIGLRIDKESSIPHVLSLAVTNGIECYFPTRDQLLRKGYETEMYEFYHIQPFGDHADYKLIIDTLENLKKIEKDDEKCI